MQTVVVILREDWRQEIFAVALSALAATALMKAMFGPEYQVEWSHPHGPSNGIQGAFPAITGLSCAHVAYWSFNEWPVHKEPS